MNLDSLLMIITWALALVIALALLSSITHPNCGTRGHGRRCNVHNGTGEWK